MEKTTVIGVDLAKAVLQVHVASEAGEVRLRRKLPRAQFLRFMAGQAPAVVVMEACASAHHWARELMRLGHEVKLIAPVYVKPFVKRQKSDAADAEAIVVAALSPGMRFVEAKTSEQQARAALFRGRERLVHHRTELVNALRALLYEFGHVAPKGVAHLPRLARVVEDPASGLPEIVCKECRDLLEQIVETTARIEERDRSIASLAAEGAAARRLQTMPGVGPVTALAIEAFAPPMASFRRARDFAAWLGLVPRQRSSGGRERLGRISKAGQADIRRLLIIGAMSRLHGQGLRGVLAASWLGRLLARKPKMVAAIAQANKMARAIWAMLTKGEDYREPALPAA